MDLERDVGGIRCFEVLAVLSDYVDGELAPELRAKVDLHLGGCANCATFGGRFGAMVKAVRMQTGSVDQT